jgi:hypothetical protein
LILGLIKFTSFYSLIIENSSELIVEPTYFYLGSRNFDDDTGVRIGYLKILFLSFLFYNTAQVKKTMMINQYLPDLRCK